MQTPSDGEPTLPQGWCNEFPPPMKLTGFIPKWLRDDNNLFDERGDEFMIGSVPDEDVDPLFQFAKDFYDALDEDWR